MEWSTIACITAVGVCGGLIGIRYQVPAALAASVVLAVVVVVTGWARGWGALTTAVSSLGLAGALQLGYFAVAVMRNRRGGLARDQAKPSAKDNQPETTE
jgi:hypothetical protein